MEIWSDLHHKIVKDSRGAIKKVINVDSVYTSIDNILGTMQGERVMLPEFASNLNNIVFDPIDRDMINWLSREVKRVIERWDDRVTVDGVDFYTDPDRSYVQMVIYFRIRGYDRTFEFRKKIGGQ